MLGAAGCAWGAAIPAAQASATASCVVRPAQTEGPYFVDRMLERSDLRVDPADGSISPGTPLVLVLAVSRADACVPLPGAQVDLWHCDHRGIYSGVRDPAMDTTGQRFLRGYQFTDAAGEARFTTIYPGWYPGRAVHIHFKVRTAAIAGRSHEFTSQLYFDDSLNERVHAAGPYAGRGSGRRRNASDRIFLRGGDELMLDLQPRDGVLAGRFELALDGV
ncbi:MAG: intradiol ring-cleavage dioxygenase [Steroidobacteraceae bacterium]